MLDPKDLNKIYFKSKMTAQQQLAQFISETGRKLSVIISSIAFLAFTGVTIFGQLWWIAYTLIMLIVFGSVTYIIVWIFAKQINELKSDRDVMAQHQMKVAEIFNDDNHRFNLQNTQRIKNLEESANFAVWEADLETGIILHTNSKFEKLFGWTKDQINEIIKNVDMEYKPQVFADLFIPEDHKQFVLEAIEDRLLNKVTKPLIHRIKLKDKFDNRFKATLIINILPHTTDDENKVIQGFVVDTEAENECLNTIRTQNTLLTKMIEYFTNVSSDADLTQDLINEFKKIKEELKNG